eukprot:9475562-Pyramimonas_sp.AAC.1
MRRLLIQWGAPGRSDARREALREGFSGSLGGGAQTHAPDALSCSGVSKTGPRVRESSAHWYGLRLSMPALRAQRVRGEIGAFFEDGAPGWRW